MPRRMHSFIGGMFRIAVYYTPTDGNKYVKYFGPYMSEKRAWQELDRIVNYSPKRFIITNALVESANPVWQQVEPP